MVNRILWSAAITMALTLSPNLAFSVPDNPEEKKSSPPQEMVIKKSNSYRSSKTGRTRLSRNPSQYNPSEPWNFHELIVTRSKAFLNAPYARGASLKNSPATDCSGFVQFIYHGFRIDLPRSSAEQAQVGKVVTRHMDFSKLLPGDLLFFRRGVHIGHSGIYLGDGKMIHASTHRYGVIISDLRQSYYEGKLQVARRVIEVNDPS
jgi:cell wall-associated NlpC family hydrolase